MGYLTNYTFAKLCKQLDIKKDIDLNLFIKHVYNDSDVFFILNKFEIRYLFNYRSLLENEDKYLANYYEYVPEKEDQKKFVFEKGGKAKYHLSSNCQFIGKDFVGFVIPSEIQALGDNVIEEYREWFKSKGYAEQFFNNTLDLTKVVFSYNILFPKKYDIPPLNEGFKLIEERANSQNIRSEDFDYSNFLIQLERIKMDYHYMFSSKVTRIISKFDSLLNKTDEEIREKIKDLMSPEFIDNYGMDKLKGKFMDSRKLKTELMAHLLDYFKWTFKLKDKDFTNTTLERFGLECCGHCKSQELLTNN